MAFDVAPIALFVYNRPWHTRQTIEALQNNLLSSESQLFVFSDGPKNCDDQFKVDEVRTYLKTISGFLKVELVCKKQNLGLANSIINGVSDVVSRFGKVIVLEDDLVTSPYFLSYMNDALVLYRDEEKVISIHGYTYPVKGQLPETFFLKGADCWGWGTWKRGWDLFEADGSKLLKRLKTLCLERRFDFNGTYKYTRMLKNQVVGKNDSWAVRWYASALINDKLTLYPGRSFVQNIGTDKSGTHCFKTDSFLTNVSTDEITVEYVTPEEDQGAFNAFEAYFKSICPPYYKLIFSKFIGIDE